MPDRETRGRRIAYQVSPGLTTHKKLLVYSAKPGYPVNAVIVCPSLVGCLVHFFDKRTRPHIEPRENCEGCQRRCDTRWKGYLGCWDRGKGRLCFAEVTKEAYERCNGFQDYKDKLRGMCINLTRNGESRNAKVTARLSLYAGKPDELPPPFDLQRALEHLWFTHEGEELPVEEYLAGKMPEQQQARTVQADLFREEGPYGR